MKYIETNFYRCDKCGYTTQVKPRCFPICPSCEISTRGYQTNTINNQKVREHIDSVLPDEEPIKENLFYLLREYCISVESCSKCFITHTDDEDNGFRCRAEDIDDWSDEEIEKYTKLLRDWGKAKLHITPKRHDLLWVSCYIR